MELNIRELVTLLVHSAVQADGMELSELTVSERQAYIDRAISDAKLVFDLLPTRTTSP